MTEQGAASEFRRDPFDPRKHFRLLKSNAGPQEYLDVKWMVLWFRQEYPLGIIETQAVQIDDTVAIFKSRVIKERTIVDGVIFDNGVSEGYGSVAKQSFRDYIEKAETRATGRALRALGYGSQFADPKAEVDADIEYRAELERREKERNQTRQSPAQSQGQNPPAANPPGDAGPVAPKTTPVATGDPSSWTGVAAFWRNQIDNARSIGTLEAINAVSDKLDTDRKQKPSMVIDYLDKLREEFKLGPSGIAAIGG